MKSDIKPARRWFVYILHCADNTFYTGITTDITRREKEHNSQTASAAKYTRARQPVRVIYQELLACRATAGRREAAIKKLSRRQKEKLIQGNGQICLFYGAEPTTTDEK